MKKAISIVLLLFILVGLLPSSTIATGPLKDSFQGKTFSILGDSISTFAGVSNDTSANSTLNGSSIYYSKGTLGVYRDDTWWDQAVDRMGMRLLVNNSWSASCIYKERAGTVGAYIDRCVQLHNSAGEDPDIIAVYLGTNDFWAFPDTLGSANDVDYDALITATEDGFEYAEPQNTCEAYAIMLHKMQQRYPNAEIYCFSVLTRNGQTAAKLQSLQDFNASLLQIATHFGIHTVDLYNDCGIKPDKNFKTYVADNAYHPGPLGMDAITSCFISSVLQNSRYINGTVYDVTYNLNSAIVNEGTAYAALEGDTFSCSFTAPFDYFVKASVTMGGEDITESCYDFNQLTIDNVTGDIQITVWIEQAPLEPLNFRWVFQDDQLVSTTQYDSTINRLKLMRGSIEDGTFSNVQYSLEQPIYLKHTIPWVLEWKSTGTWHNSGGGAFIFAHADTSSGSRRPFLYRQKDSDLIAFGTYSNNQYHTYGIPLSAHGIDSSVPHTHQLVNRIAVDGSNMIYLYVDNQELGPMNQYWINGVDQGQTVDWVNGWDMIFGYMGSQPLTIGDCSIEYIQVWENGHTHSYVRGICSGCGAADPNMVRPTLTLKSPALEFKDLICIAAFFTAENTENVDEMGMITFNQPVEQWTVENADHVIPGASYVESTGRYYATSQGIHAKQLADTIYLAVYAKMTDGSYVYSKLVSYSASTYAYNQLEKSDNAKLRQLVISMLNYGATAQVCFNHNVDHPANAGITDEHRKLVESFRPDMVQPVDKVETEKQGIFRNNNGFASRKPAVSFEGAFSINYFFTPAYTPVGDVTMYYWTMEDLATAEVLSPDNATGSMIMVDDGTGQYRSDIVNIAAKDLSEAVYVAAIYSDGTNTWTSGVLGYSIGTYCSNLAQQTGIMSNLGRVTALYGFYAKRYFG